MAHAIDRDALHAKLVKAVDAWAKGCEATVRPLTTRLIARLKKSKASTPISKIVDDEMRKLGIDAKLRKSMKDLVIEAVAHGYGILPSMMASRDKVGNKLMTTPWSGDDMTLSERLYANAKHMRAVVSDAIQTARRQGQIFTQAARVLYDGYNSGQRVIDAAKLPQYMQNVEQAARHVLTGGDLREFQRDMRKAQRAVDRLAKGGAPNKALKSAYQQMLNAAESGSQKHLERAIRTAVEERSRYHAERIARTEAARAYFDGFLARNANDDDVIGYRWTIGGRHPKTDICDDYAAADNFHMGAGVYPKDKVPGYPAHPHCLCHLSEVYADEVPGYRRAEKAVKAEKPESRVEAKDIEETKVSPDHLRDEMDKARENENVDGWLRQYETRDEYFKRLDAIEARFNADKVRLSLDKATINRYENMFRETRAGGTKYFDAQDRLVSLGQSVKMTDAEFAQTSRVKMLTAREAKYESWADKIASKYGITRDKSGAFVTSSSSPKASKALSVHSKLIDAHDRAADAVRSRYANHTETGLRLSKAFIGITDPRDKNDMVWAYKNAPEPLMKALEKYGGEFDVVRDGTSDVSHYSPGVKKIIFSTRMRGDFLFADKTRRHETGHAIDHSMSRPSLTVFAKPLGNDVKVLRSRSKAAQANLDEIRRVLADPQSNIPAPLRQTLAGLISDATKNKVKMAYARDDGEKFISSHKDEYFKQDGDGKSRKEVFAHLSDIIGSGNTNEMKLAEKILPETYAAYYDVLTGVR